MRKKLESLGFDLSLHDLAGADFYLNENCVVAVDVGFKYSDASLEIAEERFEKSEIGLETFKNMLGNDLLMKEIRKLGLELSQDIDFVKNALQSKDWILGTHPNKNVRFVIMKKSA